MKSITMPVHEQFNEENKNELFSEVKETVAETTIEKNQESKGITVQEMWNRHRHMSSASSRIRRWNLN